MDLSMPSIKIQHTASGSSATVHPFGATITSYVTSTGYETLFVSSLAKLDGSKAIRGGIPLVFPIFGPPTADKPECHNMPQHGFLRCNTWKLEGEPYDREDEAGCEFTLALQDAVSARGDAAWSSSATEKIDCRLSLVVKVGPESMTTVLTVKNTGGEDIYGYQALFHTYLRIHGANAALDSIACNVSGLEGYKVEDKITNETYILSTGGDGTNSETKPISVDGKEVDRIYHPPKDKPIVDVVVCTGSEGQKVRLTASAVNGAGEDMAVSAVVWNPYIAKAKGMGDFGDEEYNEMICVEPGILSGEGRVLTPGMEVMFTQVLKQF